MQLMLQLFCQEEFFRRLQLSQFHDKLILKGGLLLYSLSRFTGRPTMDVDLLAKSIRSESSTFEKVIREIVETNTGNGYITFEIMSTEPVTGLEEYSGVRAKLVGCIKNTRTAFHIDIGIGDVIVPKPVARPKWERFERDRLTHPLDLVEVMNTIYALIGPVFDAILDEREAFGAWDQSLERYTSAGDASESCKDPD